MSAYRLPVSTATMLRALEYRAIDLLLGHGLVLTSSTKGN